MKIIFENPDILICEKPVGISSQNTPKVDGMADEVKMYCGYGAVINRLDTMVGGAILFAKNQEFAAHLSKLAVERTIDKTYLAIVEGVPEEVKGIYMDLLFKDSRKNKSFVVKRERKGVKKASLEYEVMESANFNGKILTLVKIKLHTGRTHQIRVQFSSRKMPLCGDGKYGSKDNRCTVALWSHKLAFSDVSGDIEGVSYPPSENYPWNLFKTNLENL